MTWGMLLKGWKGFIVALALYRTHAETSLIKTIMLSVGEEH